MRNYCLAVLALGFLAPGHARAAEGLDSCTGFITTLPATITSQGVWCLSGDLSSNLMEGTAIQIAANNVTVDCNGFKLGNLAAGETTYASGIASGDQVNAAVRNCNIRGFYSAINLSGTGALVEDNRIEGSGQTGISSWGGGGVIRRNQITDTGGVPMSSSWVAAIMSIGDSDVLDNSIDGVGANGDNTHDVIGIHAFNTNGAVFAGNRIRGIDGSNALSATGMNVSNETRVTIRDNSFIGTAGANTFGVRCGDNGSASARNVYTGFNTAVSGCISWEDVVYAIVQ